MTNFERGDRVQYTGDRKFIGTVVRDRSDELDMYTVWWDKTRLSSTVYNFELEMVESYRKSAVPSITDEDLLTATDTIVSKALAELDSDSTSVVRLSIAVHEALRGLTVNCREDS